MGWSMDRVHGPGPRGGPWTRSMVWSMDPGPCFVYVREILPVLRVLSLVLCLTFLSIVLTIVQMTHPGVTCLLVELVLTYPPEEVHLLKCVNKNKNIINNCAWM